MIPIMTKRKTGQTHDKTQSDTKARMKQYMIQKSKIKQTTTHTMIKRKKDTNKTIKHIT